MAWNISASASESNVNINSNTSQVTVTLSVSWTYGSGASDSPSWTITIDGTTYRGTANFNTGYSSSGSQVVARATKTITHNSDGSKTISYSAGYAGTGSGWKSVSGSKTLTKIARSSTMQILGTTLLLGSGITVININRKQTSYTDRLVFTFGSKSKELDIEWTSTNTGIAILSDLPESWASEIPNSFTGTGTFTLTTYNGNAVVGSTQANITVKLADGYYLDPTFDAVTAVGTPTALRAAGFVRGFSKVRVRSSATGYNGSTITNTVVNVAGVDYTGSDITSDVLDVYGNLRLSLTVTDSRGQKSGFFYPITVYDYQPPYVDINVTSSFAERKNTIQVISQIADVNGVNAKRYKLYGSWMDADGTIHTEQLLQSGNITTPTFNLYHYVTDASINYTYKVRVEDSIGHDVAEALSGIIAISRKAGGKGVTFGGAATEEGLISKWNTRIDNDAEVVGQFTLQGQPIIDHVVEEGVSGDWTYRKWKSGKKEAWFSHNYGTLNLTTNYAGGVYSNTTWRGNAFSFPTGLFKKTPIVVSNIMSNVYTLSQVSDSNTTRCIVRVWSSYSSSPTNCIVQLYAYGE